jgi:hypothetical protein
MGLIIVLGIRLIAPLAVLRWPFAGSLLAIAADAVDIIIFQLTDFPSIGYHRADKLLDVYYISLEAIVAQRWESLPRWTASVLFVYRVVGTMLYEFTGARVLLVVFPNLFEFFFVFFAAVREFWPAYELTPRRTAAWLLVLLAPKMAQEYALHYAKWLDNLVAVDIIEDTARAAWRWLRAPLP